MSPYSAAVADESERGMCWQGQLRRDFFIAARGRGMGIDEDEG